MAESPTHDEGSGYLPIGSFADWATLVINNRVWDACVERLDDARPRTASAASDSPSYRRSLIAAAALNSGAIEGLHGAGRGLTRSVINNVAVWEPLVRSSEGSLAEAFVKASIEGFDMALDVATHADVLSEVWIRSLHDVVCAPQKTVPVVTSIDGQLVRTDRPFLRGAYKSGPNNVELADGSVHWYCPVAEVPIEMQRLVDALRSPEFEAAHPVLQASFAHHGFVAIHPFQDGNGRVARILASIYLLRAASIPLFIYDDERLPYFDALAAADRDDRQAFVNFVERISLDTLGFASDLARRTASPLTVTQPRERIAEDISLAARRLDELVASEFRRLGDTISVGKDIVKRWEPMHFGATDQAVNGRWPVTTVAAQIRLESESTKAGASRFFRVFASESTDTVFPISVGANEATADLEFRLDDLHPKISTRAEIRVETMIQRVVEELAREAQREIDQRGG